MEYPGRSDLVLVRRMRQPDLIRGAVREAAAWSGSGRVWLVAAEAGDRNPTWNQAMDDLGRIARRRLPRLMVVDHHGAERSGALNPRDGDRDRDDDGLGRPGQVGLLHTGMG